MLKIFFLWEGKGNYEGRLKFTYILYSLGQRTFYIIICEKSGYLETDIFHEHVQCAYLVPWTKVCEQLQSFSCWLEVVSLFHSIPFPETEFSEKNEVNDELTGSDAKTRPVHSSFAWLGVQRKILVWSIGVVLGQMVWSASMMCSKVDVLLCRWCTHEWKKPMRSLKAWCKTRILTWGKVACIQ